jgi:hypothetical protein
MSHWSTPLLDFFLKAVVRTQGYNINPLCRLFLKLQREIKLNLTSLFNCKGKKKSKEK